MSGRKSSCVRGARWLALVVIVASVVEAQERVSDTDQKTAAGPTVETPTARAIKEVLARQREAWNRGDIEAFMQDYWKSEQLTFSSGGQTTRGWEATRQRYRQRYPNVEQMGQLTFDQLEVFELSESAALVLGRWKLQRAEPVGGNFSIVLRRFDDRWLIVHDHTSVEAPPPAKGPAGGTPPPASTAGNRSATIDPLNRLLALRTLPDIQEFQSKPSDRFLVDLEVVRTGHPYKGENAVQPHTGGHIHFGVPDPPLPPQDPSAFPAIYAVADGVISRVDYAFRLSAMYEPALERKVANVRYGIGLMFAVSEGSPVEMHYSIEPFVDPGEPKFYDPFILVKPGQRVKKGDVIARMYIPNHPRLAQSTHIHFNLIGGSDHRFMAPSIFSPAVVERFHATWRDWGRDGEVSIPPCMGYKLTPRENPFGTGAADQL